MRLKYSFFTIFIFEALFLVINSYNKTCKAKGGCLWCQIDPYGCSEIGVWACQYNTCDLCLKSNMIGPGVCNDTVIDHGFKKCGDYWINFVNNGYSKKDDSCIVPLADGCEAALLGGNSTYKNQRYICPDIPYNIWLIISICLGVIVLIVICWACDKYQVRPPIVWQEKIFTHCKNCRGAGEIQNSHGWNKCPICHGAGKY